jgi:uncharacterized membrane protein (TIGR01666 family)
MDYSLELRKFVNSQYLYAGLRITAGVIIPAMVLYHYGLLAPMIGLPMGALFTSQTDSPGAPEHRRNGMLISISLNFIIIIIAGYSSPFPVLISIEIIFFGLFLSLIGLYGSRANTIGIIALVVFLLNLKGGQHVFRQALLFAAGGIWYTFLSLLLYTLRPYRPVQQLLGETLMDTANYLRTRSLFYKTDVDQQSIYPSLFDLQVKIHQEHEQLRETMFSTRKFITESTVKGRMLTMIFLDAVDLMERIMTAQQDYELLLEKFGQTEILDVYYRNINILAVSLYGIGLSVQAGEIARGGIDLEAEIKETSDKFDQLRSQSLNADNIEGFIILRHILYNLQDITERIRRLKAYTTFDKNINTAISSNEVEYQEFSPKTRINIDLLFSNFSLQSTAFRHALRLTLALLTGYFVSLIFPISHGYWVMLTIATIIKPAYSLTKARNIQRLIGTFIGAAAGFGLLSLVQGETALFVIMVISMIIAYSMLKLNYGVFCAFLTLFLLLNFHFLDPNGIQKALLDRILDTVIGSAIAYIFANFVLPTWEHQQTSNLIRKAMLANRKYFDTVANAFTGMPADVTTFKLSRKEAFVALANLSDNFRRMMSEPKSKQSNLPEYHQFIAANHMLTSHIASLSYYAQRSAKSYASPDFKPLIKEIDQQFELIIDMPSTAVMENNLDETLPLHKKLQELLSQRKKELESGVDAAREQFRKTLSELKTIIDQFGLISSTLNEQRKILEQVQSS